ncbi:MAG TPA: hypothetical protein EYH45_04850 [Candidatus Caldiarchaeum subterraneum]|uniref:Transcription factor Pcc1 n=1 Tax=Caldiarchaeum subterraneum TaxID=311458 RepID=A0A832ZVY4_CALS0|nr:hypothetical protein [Aigarchaeota archaeon]HIQ29874.1 hypothetical protein [Candidatus Caldarchaeum subterraneum]
MAKVAIEILIPRNSIGNVIYTAVKPEVEDVKSRRTHVTLEKKGQVLTLGIRASDITAARAAVNSFIRLLHVVIDVSKVVEDGV